MDKGFFDSKNKKIRLEELNFINFDLLNLAGFIIDNKFSIFLPTLLSPISPDLF